MSDSTINLMAHREVLDALMAAHRLTPKQAEKSLPERPGVYAIFVENAESLPQPFADLHKGHESDPVYIGKASSSIQKRCHDQDLRHKSAATFFRTIGAVLGYTPPKGSLIGKKNKNNYKFSSADTAKIIKWLDEHVTVSAIEVPPDQIKTVEPELIRTVMPLLNTQCNPQALPELAQLREHCRQIAVQTN
jgi:GIY-YIG catalytic domain